MQEKRWRRAESLSYPK